MSEYRSVSIGVVTADALSFSTDVLVLKHAQVSLGVDLRAKERLDLSPGMNLPPGGQLIVSGRPALGAEQVVFLGVPPLQDFGYSEIRLFARRAVALVGQELPAVKSIALTLHGAGYGLDEIACLDAELAGLLDALELGTAPASLNRLAIVEADAGRADRLRRHLEGTFDGADPATVTARSDAEIGNAVGRIASTTSADRDYAFVAMPFSGEFDDAFHYGIQPSVHANGLLCERIDQSAFTGDVLTRIKEKIRGATLMVADLTGANPNVYLEVGFPWASGVPTVLLRRQGSDLKFDVQGEKCLRYSSIKDLEDTLTQELGQLTS
jgi:hypothetical protein